MHLNFKIIRKSHQQIILSHDKTEQQSYALLFEITKAQRLNCKPTFFDIEFERLRMLCLNESLHRRIV